MFQVCCEVYDSLMSGEFGAQGKNVASSYKEACWSIFKYAAKFKPEMVNLKQANDNDKREISEEHEP
jgi:hypothetical protein